MTKRKQTGPACSSCGTAQDPADPARCAECGSTMFTGPDTSSSDAAASDESSS